MRKSKSSTLWRIRSAEKIQVNFKEVFMLEEFYEKEISVCQYDCDFKNRMKLGAVLRQVQQVSEDHCNAIGLTAEKHLKSHTAFLLTKLSVTVYGNIFANEHAKLITKPYFPNRAVYRRKTCLYDEAGREAFFIDSKWILIDTETKRILRKPPDTLQFPFTLETLAHPENLEIKPMNTRKIGNVTASYSQVDINGHINNASYVDIICDHLPEECFCDRSIKKMVLAFHHEVQLGEEMHLFLSDFDELGQSYFYGTVNGKNCFEANIVV